jgi:hypothetical protein
MDRSILVDEAEDLGGGNFRVRLRVGNGENQLTHADIISAPSCDAAVQKAREDFSRWLKMVFDVAAKSAGRAKP